MVEPVRLGRRPLKHWGYDNTACFKRGWQNEGNSATKFMLKLYDNNG